MARKKATKKSGRKGQAKRPIWRGHITFGLVQVPVVLQPAESRHDLSFRLLDSRNKARIRYERVNEVTGEEVPWNEIVKAYEYDDSNYVVLSDTDFKRAAVEATKAVEIEQFIDPDDVNPMYYDTPYYLVPDTKGDKGYALLREALRRTKKVGIARVVIRTRQYMCLLYVQDDALVVSLLRFHQELRELPADLPSSNLKSNGITQRELDMAVSLVESMAGTWKPEGYHDEYRDALMKWIEKKAKAGGVMPPEPEEEPDEERGQIINIADLLQKSLHGRAKPARTAGKSRKAPAARKKKAG